jgi:PTS system nitrogen regulatory IIA component
MDLEIADVAELLNVSEATVLRWLHEEKIPAYQLNGKYRFSRSEVEDWVVRSQGVPGERQIYPTLDEPKGGLHSFALMRAMHKGGVLLDVAATTKEGVIREVVGRIAPRLGLDAEMITELLLSREGLMSTALGQGIAVPHPRETVLPQPGADVVVTVFLKTPVPFGALDGAPVHTLFFLFSSSDKTHLHLLSKIAHLSSHDGAQALFQRRPSAHDFLSYVKEWESKIRYPR